MRLLIFVVLLLVPVSDTLAADYQKYVGKLYGPFREVLVFDSWTPAETTKESDCFNKKDTPKCAAFPEILYCAGTGLAACQMKWSTSTHNLLITTASEIYVRITSVKLEPKY